MSCRPCWWREGDYCHLAPVARTPDGRSTKNAVNRCDGFKSKRKVFSAFTPPDVKLVIMSEES